MEEGGIGAANHRAQKLPEKHGCRGEARQDAHLQLKHRSRKGSWPHACNCRNSTWSGKKKKKQQNSIPDTKAGDYLLNHAAQHILDIGG